MRQFLFIVDLDGTLLDDTITSRINDLSKKAIQKAIQQGHVVCIVTGRPWRSTKGIYEELGLNTVVANYNGAFIHNPKDASFYPKVVDLMLNNILYIREDVEIQKRLENFAIEGLNWIQMEKSDPPWEKFLAVEHATKSRVGRIDYKAITLKPLSALMNLRISKEEVFSFQKYLKAHYADIADFPTWMKFNDPNIHTFAIVPRGITKTIALSVLMRYYNVPYQNIVTFGDGFNDLEIIENSFISVATSNAESIIKKSAVFVSEFSNKEGAVGKFIEKFLENPDFFIQKAKNFHIKRDIDKVAYC